jgi:hypothetical protein
VAKVKDAKDVGLDRHGGCITDVVPKGGPVRAPASLFLLVGLAAPALAQDQGSFVVDAMTTPGRHFGAGYYMTDRLSIRPSLGFGYSGAYGTTFNFGTDLRLDLLPASRFSPYLTAGINYMRSPFLVPESALAATSPASTNVARYGGGLGIRTHVKWGLSLLGEARVMSSEIRSGSEVGLYGASTVHDGAHFEGAIGLSYVLN